MLPTLPNDTELRHLYAALRRRLARQGWTLTRLAREAQIDRAHLSRAFNGRGELSAPQWRAVYQAMGVWEAVLDATVRAVEEG